MRFLIAADSFKDALSAEAVCNAIARGLRAAQPQSEVIPFPLADGGEGTVEVLLRHLNAEMVELEVEGPLWRPVKASYLWSAEKQTAYIEMAQASGLPLLKEEERNPLHTTTFGTGQLIRHAVGKLGVRHIYLSIGGSATNDMGIGLAAALGCRFLDAYGKPLKPVGGNLSAIRRVEREDLVVDLSKISCTVLCDVENPLYGPEGAAHVFAPQKGASPEDVEKLDAGLRHLASLLQREWGTEVADIPGAGAAGGLGAGAVAFLNARLQSGIETMLDLTGFQERAAGCDYIFTGEGKLDSQSIGGKLIRGITRAAEKADVPVIALCGRLDLSPDGIRELGLRAAFSISDGPQSLAEALRRTEVLLEFSAFNVGRVLSA